MNKQIPGFSNYTLTENNEVIRISDGKIMPIYSYTKSKGFLKLKNDGGVFKTVGYATLVANCSEINPPKGFCKVPGFKHLYCNELSEFWTEPTVNSPLGRYLKVYYPKDSSKYPTISTSENTAIAVHQVLAITFLDKDYLAKGLCVMHLDDNKHNFNLSNLKIGTYSENNKAAYDTGANPSKKQ